MTSTEPRAFDATEIHDTVYATVQADCVARARAVLGSDAPDDEVMRQAAMFHAFIIGWPSPSNSYH